VEPWIVSADLHLPGLESRGELGVHHEHRTQPGEDGERAPQVGLRDRWKLVEAMRRQHALEPEHAPLEQLGQLPLVPGHDPAQEAHVHPALLLGRLALGAQSLDGRGRRQAPERHVHDGRDPAGRGGAGGREDALPLRAPGLGRADMRVHQSGEDHEVAGGEGVVATRDIVEVPHRLDHPVADVDRSGLELAAGGDAMAANDRDARACQESLGGPLQAAAERAAPASEAGR
jgi:hypothetical protein